MSLRLAGFFSYETELFSELIKSIKWPLASDQAIFLRLTHRKSADVGHLFC